MDGQIDGRYMHHDKGQGGLWQRKLKFRYIYFIILKCSNFQ